MTRNGNDSTALRSEIAPSIRPHLRRRSSEAVPAEEAARFEIIARYRLAAVDAVAWHERRYEHSPDSFANAVGALAAGEALEVSYAFNDGRGDLAIFVDLLKEGGGRSIEVGHHALLAALRLAFPTATFEPVSRIVTDAPGSRVRQAVSPATLRLVPTAAPGRRLDTAPAGLTLVDFAPPSRSPASVSDDDTGVRDAVILFDAQSFGSDSGPFDRAPIGPAAPLDRLLRGLDALGRPVTLSLRYSPVCLDARAIRTLRDASTRFSYGNATVKAAEPGSSGLAAASEERLAAMLDDWLARSSGYRIDCTLESDPDCAEALGDLVCRELFGVPRSALEPGFCEAGLDLRGCLPDGFPVPDPLAAGHTLRQFGFGASLPQPRAGMAKDGHALGIARNGRAVALSPRDLQRHTYIVGATGTGKSTLMLNMFGQDCASGRGTILIDPHGDLFCEAVRRVGRDRRHDLVTVDFTDFDNPPALNPLELRGTRREIAQNFVCNEMIRILSRTLYRDVPEAFGPIFEMYFRNSLLLIMANERSDLTLLNVERIYADPNFRADLLSSCPLPRVREFWLRIAARVSHQDWTLENIAPYIVSKLTQFTGNALIRPIIGQTGTNLDFGRWMDEGRIVVVNLSRGILGEVDSEILGLLVMTRIYVAAMARAERRAETRTPVRLYIDEFQNLATESLASMLSESRKYGVHLTLANQTLGQIDGSRYQTDIAHAVLANAANLLAFRVGVPDAERLVSWFRPGLDADQLARLPDFNAAARLVNDGRPLAPFVFETAPF